MAERGSDKRHCPAPSKLAENNDVLSDEEEDAKQDECPRRLRRAEAVLRKRTGRIVLVLDQLAESFNQQAMIRTAESLGIQYIYAVRRAGVNVGGMVSIKILKGSKNWVTIRLFAR